MTADELNYWFGEFWKIYPRRRDKLTAMKAYRQATTVSEPETINNGALQYAQERFGRDAEFTKYPATWLRAGGWMDYEAAPVALPSAPAQGAKIFLREGSPEFEEWCRHDGKRYPVKNGGWWFDSLWPPGHEKVS